MAVEVVAFAKHVKKVLRSKNGPMTTKQKEFNENHPQLRTGKGEKKEEEEDCVFTRLVRTINGNKQNVPDYHPTKVGLK